MRAETFVYAIMLAVFVLFLASIGSCVVDRINTTPCNEIKTIKSVGGCDRDGYCGVVYEEGGAGRHFYPTPGVRVTVYKRCPK